MSVPVTIVDYGSGNLLSVARALQRCGSTPTLSHDASEIESAQRLVLPGVGAFGDGMQSLRERGLIDSLRRYAASGRPMLGICLGMQMFATVSVEFGEHEGIGLIPGRVVPVPAIDLEGAAQKIPHIGWAELSPAAPGRWEGSVFSSTPENTSLYLVHSYHFEPDDPAHRLADCFYGGHRLAAAVRSENILGCQFHPEKSGEAGLSLLDAFLRQ